MGRIEFGTDGWRAIIAEDFTMANVCLVAQAIANYLQQVGLGEQGVVIGYDNRFMSDRFAAGVAEVLAASGIRSWLPEATTPTPVTAFAVKKLGAGGAVMITASHNPPEYNGIKFIPHYAGPATAEITGAIEREIACLESVGEVRRLPLARARSEGFVEGLDPKPAYLEHLHALLDYRTISSSMLKIVVDPMWGSGAGYIKDVLRAGSGSYTMINDYNDIIGLAQRGAAQIPGGSLKMIHNYRDPLFGNSLPEPTAEGLKCLGEQVVADGADLGLALDSDADRFGVVDNQGVFVSPNEVLYMALYYILEYRRWRGAVARTVATTHMLDRIADDYGLPVVETPVGFQYIGQSLIHHRSILGCEESGGMSVQGHIPEKDGILALAMIVEMLAARRQSLREFQEEVLTKFGRLVSKRFDYRCDPELKGELLARLEQWSPVELLGQQVTERKTIDGVKLILADGSWVLVCPSGTEPLFRIYAEAVNDDLLQNLQVAAKVNLGL